MALYFYLILGLGILLIGGKFLVDGASSLALRFGMSPGLIGLTVVAFGTSAPELLVSINAALKGSSDLALGNVIGSNISNISLILGISAIVYPIAVHPSVLKLDYLVMLISSLLFFLVSLNGTISRLEGAVFFLLLIGVNLYFILKLRLGPNGVDLTEVVSQPLWKGFSLLILGIIGLYFGSELLVNNAVTISQTFGVSERVIGVTIVAIGTSLPELVTSLIAAIDKKTDLAVGNILGSNIFNILSIIGLTSLIQPIQVSQAFIQKDFIWMLGLSLVLFPALKSKHGIVRWEGGGLLILYGLYVYSIL
ncbi:calcium/sodium antiporter [Mariniradius sediminis]|jgi:cation:H+ antiporter|uniref:Calcium/sodium antiporter n=1 Tax=Mariniradius sediminis TaxID=2909237 RepID=A0ABS9BPD8_9BACT|nr:calcium/sodium antiporter [Mariniradius sediminis]MCF1749913.1 calcium/sodium antiporter [Mariniradius sediminis]